MVSEQGVPGQAWEDVAAGVWRRRLPGWDETVGVVAGEAGLLLVDAGPSPRAGAALRRELAGIPGAGGLPVRWLVITHPHFDHVLGAAAFAGAEVYGAAGLSGHLAPAALAADAVRHGMDEAEAAEAAEALRAAVPDVVEVAGGGELVLGLGGGREVVVANAGPGHTGHDLAVVVPGEPRVVFCGDLVEESGEPQAGEDARPARWPAALDRLLALGGERARYVPGHGAVVDAAFVRAQRGALARRFGVVD
ncbi:MBL fold metallo-hydrolase [Streptomyces sp. 6N223]|uniref:MBL fold metallo-hydrolase n=1 Tax=Streptomyces sp. 6N223 TaxID=3457412 RepID=UPI003FCF1D81